MFISNLKKKIPNPSSCRAGGLLQTHLLYVDHVSQLGQWSPDLVRTINSRRKTPHALEKPRTKPPSWCSSRTPHHHIAPHSEHLHRFSCDHQSIRFAKARTSRFAAGVSIGEVRTDGDRVGVRDTKYACVSVRYVQVGFHQKGAP